MLGGLLVWAGHFFTLYILASVFGTSMVARIGTGIATVAAVVVALLLLRSAALSIHSDPLFRWMASVKTLAAALAIVAVLFQAMPALIG